MGQGGWKQKPEQLSKARMTTNNHNLLLTCGIPAETRGAHQTDYLAWAHFPGQVTNTVWFSAGVSQGLADGINLPKGIRWLCIKICLHD